MAARAAAALLALTLAPAFAQEGAREAPEGGAPLSAIPWLSETLTEPAPPAAIAPAPSEAGIEVAPLAPPAPAAAGLIAPARAGLPADLWAGAEPARLARALREMPLLDHPALAGLFETLLLVEAPPPAGGGEAMLLARINALIRRGALAPAQALLERAGPDSPALFRRWFDVALLEGSEDRACATLAAKPDLSPSYAAQVFCLARLGRWRSAALTLETATALGALDGDVRDRLAWFLDPEIFEGEAPPPRPDPVTPLDFRLLEAVGEPVPTAMLPLAFAHNDLRPVAGWKPRIEAAERLARAGAIDTNRLLGIYTARRPAASGGVWERVARVQALDVALVAGDAASVARALGPAAAAMRAAGLEAVFAELFAPRLSRMDLSGGAAAEAYRLALVSGTEAAFDAPPEDAALTQAVAFAGALARGEAPETAAPSALASALRAGLAADAPPAPASEGRLGAALLAALATLAPGRQADPADAGDALALIAHAWREPAARHAAAQILLLETAP